MIRVVAYLATVALLSFAAVWFADRPGDVLITWQGSRIETSVLVLVSAFAAVAVLSVLLWSVVRAILRAPETFGTRLRHQRGLRGYQAVSRGLVAVGSGNAQAALKFADEARRIAPNEPLTLLLSAQAAQLGGDRAVAEQSFQAMAKRDDTRLLALHGLFTEAQRRGDLAGARRYAEAAARSSAVPPWAGNAVLEFRCATGDWRGALERLDLNMKSGFIDQPTYRRQRAVLLTAQAMAVLATDRDAARALVIDAVKFGPTLIPAAAIAGRLLGQAGDLRRAGRIVETAWRANPHPDLADAFAHLQPGASARDRLARVQALAQMTPGNVESALAVARAALDARECAVARSALEPLVAAPTQRAATLMAELEDMQHVDEGRARAWMARAVQARRDPAWTADGVVSERWMPVSPVTGRLDAFQWRTPLAELEPDGPLIESKERVLIAALPPAPTPVSAPATSVRPVEAGLERPPVKSSARTLNGAAPPPEAKRLVPAAQVPPAVQESDAIATIAARRRPSSIAADTLSASERVIPLLHVPDDPGPELHVEEEPEVEATAGLPPESWTKLRGLFK